MLEALGAVGTDRGTDINGSQNFRSIVSAHQSGCQDSPNVWGGGMVMSVEGIQEASCHTIVQILSEGSCDGERDTDTHRRKNFESISVRAVINCLTVFWWIAKPW